MNFHFIFLLKRTGLWVGVLSLLFLIGGFWDPQVSAVPAVTVPAVAEQMETTDSMKQPADAESSEDQAAAETIKFENPEIKLEAN